MLKNNSKKHIVQPSKEVRKETKWSATVTADKHDEKGVAVSEVKVMQNFR